jgi:hypothetical protein
MSSSVINKAFKPVSPSIAKTNISNFGLIPKYDWLRWIRPDSFRLNAVYSEREMDQKCPDSASIPIQSNW